MWPWQVPLAVGGLSISSACAPKLKKTLLVWLKDKLKCRPSSPSYKGWSMGIKSEEGILLVLLRVG